MTSTWQCHGVNPLLRVPAQLIPKVMLKMTLNLW